MSSILDLLAQANSLQDLREQLGRHLGLPGPLPEAALLRALDDPGYAMSLLKAQGNRAAMQQLFDAAREAGAPSEKGGPAAPADPAATQPPSDAELLSRVARAFVRWTETGFAPVEPATLERRLAACRPCENYTDPPGRMLYRLARVLGERGRICRLCGCFVERKARMSGEACPAPDPDREGLSRWGEPLAGPGK